MEDGTAPERRGFGIVPQHLAGQLTAYELAAYVVLTWHADRTGWCFPSHNLVAEEAGMSVSSARRAVSGLASKGLLKVTARYVDVRGKKAQTSNGYRVAVWRAE